MMIFLGVVILLALVFYVALEEDDEIGRWR